MLLTRHSSAPLGIPSLRLTDRGQGAEGSPLSAWVEAQRPAARRAYQYHSYHHNVRPSDDKGLLMNTTRPATVTVAFLLVLLQIAIAVVAGLIAAFAPADYQTYAVTTPLFLVVLFAVVAYFLWVGRPWARTVTIVVAALAVIGELSVVFYYDHT